MHQLNSGQILCYYRFQGSASFADIAYNSSDNAHISIGINENLDVAHISQLLVFKYEDTFDNNNFGRSYRYSFIYSVVYGKIIYRSFDGFSVDELFDVTNHQVRIEGVRMVVIELFPVFKRNIIMSLIVKVMAQHGYGVAKFILYLLYKGALAGAGTPCNSYYDYISHMVLLLFAERCSISVLCRN